MKTVIEMAREAGAMPIHKRPKEFAVVGNEALERFAELARADEREACADLCDEYDGWIAKRIRARGTND